MIEPVDEDVVIANGMMLASVQLRGNLEQSLHTVHALGFLSLDSLASSYVDR